MQYGKQETPNENPVVIHFWATFVGFFVLRFGAAIVLAWFCRVPPDDAEQISSALVLLAYVLICALPFKWAVSAGRGERLDATPLSIYSWLALSGVFGSWICVPMVTLLWLVHGLNFGTLFVAYGGSVWLGTPLASLVRASHGRTLREYYDVITKGSTSSTAPKVEPKPPSSAKPAASVAVPGLHLPPTAPTAVHQVESDIILRLGRTTGLLAARGHLVGAAPNVFLDLHAETWCKNVLVVGGTGSGKTTCVVDPLCYQLFMSGAGVLTFDVKGEGNAQRIAALCKKPINVIGCGPDQLGLNLIEGMSTHAVVQVFTDLFSMGGEAGGFWVNNAAQRIRCALTVLRAIPNHYNLGAMYSYFFDQNARTTILGELEDALVHARPLVVRAVRAAQHWEDEVFGKFEDKVRSSVDATISQTLAEFMIDPEIHDAFCTSEREQADLTKLFDGHAFVLSVSIAEKGDSARTIMHLVKRRYANMMQSRRLNKQWDQHRFVAFICDEYQYVAAASDAEFLDKSRSSGSIFIGASQSISAFDNVIKSRAAVDTIISNMRQLIVFPLEDERTLARLRAIAGDVDRWQYGTGNSVTDADRSSESVNWSQQRSSLITGSLMRGLKENQALALLNINKLGYDDVIDCTPLFANAIQNEEPVTTTMAGSYRDEAPKTTARKDISGNDMDVKTSASVHE